MIGVFDSGSGGLTILRALQAALPHQDFLYYGDHKNAPYGHRQNDEIVELTRQGVDHLMQRGCKLVILACNTAAAVALRSLQQNWLEQAYPGNRILGVLVPMVEAITGVDWATDSVDKSVDDRILLFATRKTVASGAYREEVAKRAPNITLIEKACPGLVDAIEGGAGEAPISGMIAGFVSELGETNAVAAVLGCTHFPIVEQHFTSALGSSTTIVSQPDVVAASLVDYLGRHPLFATEGRGLTKYMTTGDADHVTKISRAFCGENICFASTLVS